MRPSLDVRSLERALKRLAKTGDDQPIARRNARRSVLGAIRSLRHEIDKSFPSLTERKKSVRVPPALQIKRLERKGWREVTTAVAGRYALLGVRARVIETEIPGPQLVHKTVRHHLVPPWAFAIAEFSPEDHATDLRKALRSHKVRNALKAAVALSPVT